MEELYGPIVEEILKQSLLVLIMVAVVIAAYRRMWVSGSEHKSLRDELKAAKSDFRKDIEQTVAYKDKEIERIIRQKDDEIERRQAELEMWRQMALYGMATLQRNSEATKAVAEVAKTQAAAVASGNDPIL